MNSKENQGYPKNEAPHYHEKLAHWHREFRMLMEYTDKPTIKEKLMFRRIHASIWVSALVALVSGCASLTAMNPVVDEIGFNKDCTTYEILGHNSKPIMVDNKPISVADQDGKISASYISAIIKGDATIDSLLDCALQPALTQEAKLYRGHVVISLLATYGAYNMAFQPYEERVGDAVTLLTHIRQAEQALRESSSVVEPNITPVKFQNRPKRLNKILYVLEVALYAERPTIRRIKGEVRSLIGALFSGAPTEIVKKGLKGATTGIRKSIKLRHFGRAYLQDAKDDLERFTGKTRMPAKEDWERRDLMIKNACTKIAQIAKVENFQCIPE